ncbi:MAG: DUF983 domain-containing protein [Vulcanimicrobiota bacterium]
MPLPKKPSGALPIFLWWLKKLFWVGGRTYCPRCEKGLMFESYFKVRKKCPECQVVLQPYPGDELGVIALGYFVTLGPSLVALVWAYFNTSLTPIQLLLLFWFLMTAILFGFYRNIKGIWIGFIYLLTGLRRKL